MVADRIGVQFPEAIWVEKLVFSRCTPVKNTLVVLRTVPCRVPQLQLRRGGRQSRRGGWLSKQWAGWQSAERSRQSAVSSQHKSIAHALRSERPAAGHRACRPGWPKALWGHGLGDSGNRVAASPGDRVASCEHGGEPPERSGGPTFVEPPRLRSWYAPGGWAGFRLPGSARPSPWAQRARLWATSLRGPTPAAPMGATRNQ